jgi:tetratricopeptide (TPR) repeat protein
MSLDDVSWWFSDLVFNGCFSSTLHDRLAGELVKARLMKASGRFDEALEIINRTLDRLPDYPEALFLKAQILWEGYSDYSKAKACLQKIIQMKKMRNEQEETVRRWSKGLLKEMLAEKRAQQRRTDADKGWR